MSKVLVKWSGNWADEMDVEGWTIMEKEESSNLKDSLRKYNNSFSISVGTNEDIEYDSGTDLLNELEFKNLKDEEYKTIVKFFGSSYGHTGFESVADYWEDEDNE